MQRGLNQVLFQFMPKKTFDNPDNNTIEQVEHISGNEIDKIDEQQLVDRIKRDVWNWQGKTRGFHDQWDAADYTITKPEHVISRVFPLVFRCGSCGLIHDYQYRREELKEHVPNCSCGGSQLWQLHHVMICGECSSIKPLRVPSCDKGHGKHHIKLDDSAERYKNFKWRCVGNGCNGRVLESGLNRFCDCGDGQRMQPTVHRASKTYRVHDLKRVDIPADDYDPESDDEQMEIRSDLALAAQFGVYDHPEKTMEHFLEIEQNEENELDDLIDDDAPDDVKEYLKQKQKEQYASSDRVNQILSEVEELREDDRPVSRTHYEYLQLLETAETEDAGELVELAETLDRNEYNKLLEDHGIESIHLTSEFPLLTAVYGYHRTFDEPEKDEYPQLRAFPLSKGNCRIYASRATTEAALIKLDPRAIADWLPDHLFDSAELDALSNEEIRARFHGEMDALNPYTDLDEVSDTSEAVHGLLHTLSHVLIKEAAMLSGIESTNLAEYLFPEAFTIAIYANQSQSFTIGGLYTLIERNLERWLATAQHESEYCIYDPVCTEQGASCHACTHINEIGCQFFNQNLSRSYLFQQRDPDEEVITGFWEA